MAAMERDYFYPEVAARDECSAKCAQGRKDAWVRANERVRVALKKPDLGYLDKASETAIRSRFDIRLKI